MPAARCSVRLWRLWRLWWLWGLWALARAAPDPPTCHPRLCVCRHLTPPAVAEPSAVPTANCSSRGLLAMPSGLPATLVDLSLAFNALSRLNASEFRRLAQLRRLDLSHNRLSSFLGGVHYHLAYLDLSFNAIDSVRSLSLEGLIALKELHLARNRLMSLPPNAFPASVVLRTLDLRQNRILSLEPGSLDQLNALQELNLSLNHLSSFPKGLFQGLSSLRVLELNKNRFIEIQGLTFHGLSGLRVLKLKRNQIEYLSDGAFFGLNAIEDISLDRNQVERVNKGWLYGMGSLRYLGLAFNRVDFIDDDSWEYCGNLSDLDLGSNRLQVLERDFLRQLPQLRRLNLQRNRISHIQDEDTFAEVPRLEWLALDHNQISHTIEDIRAPFDGLSRLRTLNLSHNPIKSVGGEAFVGLELLEELDLSSTPISTLKENAFERLNLLGSLQIDSSSVLCDCHVKWFPKWLNHTGIRGCAATCAHPENLKGTLIHAIDYASFTCDDFPKPYILEQPQTQISLKGDDLALFCRAASTSTAAMTFDWKIDSETLDLGPCQSAAGSPAATACIRNERHSFDGKGKEITSQLHLFNVTYDDAGKYQCVVTNKYGATYSDKAAITVYVYPQFVVTPEDITVEGGATAALKCAAKGVPAPKVSWSKDEGTDFPAAQERRIAVNNFAAGDDQKTNVNSFVIYNVKAQDMGTYQCKASNPAGEISWNISLSVLEVPRFVKPMESKSVPEGETAVIECQATGSPKPKLTWTKDGGPFEATERHFFTADNQLLIIVKAQTSDAGTYECSMHNQLGAEKQSSVLEVTERPVIIGDGTLDQDQIMLIIIIVLVCCLLTTSLIWVFVFVKIRQRRRQNQSPSFTHPRHATSTPNNYSRPAKGEPNPLTLTISDYPSEGEFDIDAHVRRGLRPTLNDSTSTSTTTRNPVTGVLTTDFQKAVDEASERDSGTGDSKEEGHTPDEAQQPLLPEEPKRGAGEAAISLSEFEMEDKAIPFVDSDELESEEEGGGEGAGDDLSEDESSRAAPTTVEGDEDTAGSSSSNPRGRLGPRRSGTAEAKPKVPFQTFHPPGGAPRGSQRRISELLGSSPVIDQDLSPRASNLESLGPSGLANGHKQGRKRASAVELNGKCFLAIEPEPPDRTSKLIQPEEYRGGQGTLPRNGLLDFQQALLEASLNSSDHLNQSRLSQQPLCRTSRSASRNSLFDRARKSGSLRRPKKRGQSLPRKSSAKQQPPSEDQSSLLHLNPGHSSVMFKSKEMFN